MKDNHHTSDDQSSHGTDVECQSELKNSHDEHDTSAEDIKRRVSEAIEELTAVKHQQNNDIVDINGVPSVELDLCEKIHSMVEDFVDDSVMNSIADLYFSYSDSEFEFKGRTLTQIKSHDLTEIKVPDGIAHITSQAFKNCLVVEQITLPDSVSVIEPGAFAGLRHLKSIKLPAFLDKLDDEVFMDCSALEYIDIPDGVVSIGKNLFKNCTSLQYLTFPDCLTIINNGCFANCSALEHMDLPEVVEIGELAFAGCSKLTALHIPDSVISIGQMAFKNCTALVNVHLPKSLELVPGQLFSGCSRLRTIAWPDHPQLGNMIFLRVLTPDNWERFVIHDGICRRVNVNAMEYDPDGVFDLLPEGSASVVDLLPQHSVYVTLNIAWECAQFDDAKYNFLMRIYQACMKVARIVTNNQMAAMLSLTWHLRGMMLVWRGCTEDQISQKFPQALAITLNAIGGTGTHRKRNDNLIRETFNLFLGKTDEQVKSAILSMIDVVLGIKDDFSRENPYDVRYCAGLQAPDYWLFSDVLGYLTRFALKTYIPMPEVHSDEIDDWCAAWSQAIAHTDHSVVLFELPPDEKGDRRAVSVLSNTQVDLLNELFEQVDYRAYAVWFAGAKRPLLRLM